jgi:hypothetical protein
MTKKPTYEGTYQQAVKAHNDKVLAKRRTQDGGNPVEAREAAAPAQRRLRNSRRGGIERADWNDCHSEELLAAIAAVSATGCAIRLGYTKDGGAFCIGIVGDGDPYSEYVRPTENINAYLSALAQDFQEGSGGGTDGT